MKTWRECDGHVSEQKEAVTAALAATGQNISQAARLLGISRRYLHMVLPSVLDEKSLHALLASRVTAQREGLYGVMPGVNGSPNKSLTYGPDKPNLRGVETAEMTGLKVDDFPVDLKNWLELESIRRKQRLRERHASMGRTLADIVREAKERAEREDGNQ